LKIESELKIKKETDILKEMTSYLDKLTDIDEEVGNNIESLNADLKQLREVHTHNDANIEILVKLRQGQDEVKQEAIVTDYSKSLMVQRVIVEEKNQAIVKQGTEKLKILQKRIDLQRTINFLEWERRFLTLSSKNLEEHYTDLHMLRVTKNLQEFLKSGANADHQKEDVEKATNKLQHMETQHGEKKKKAEGAISKLLTQVEEKRMENEQLDRQRAELAKSVAIRRSIRNTKSSTTAATSSSDLAAARAKKRMRSIVTRRKLIDLARAQTDEIDFLRQELDRLRQRTFPSFAHNSQILQHGPDELDY
jgi:hypothetical protein